MRKLLAGIFALIALLVYPLAAIATTVEQYPFRQYYSANTGAVTVAATATDIATLYGSSTAKLWVTRVEVTGTQTTSGNVQFFLVKRSAVNTGGTSANVTPVPLDSKMLASTAGCKSYTVNPAGLGTSAGTLTMDQILIPAAADTASQGFDTVYAEEMYGSPIVLNNANEGVAVNLNSATVTGGVITVTFWYTEILN